MLTVFCIGNLKLKLEVLLWLGFQNVYKPMA